MPENASATNNSLPRTNYLAASLIVLFFLFTVLLIVFLKFNPNLGGNFISEVRESSQVKIESNGFNPSEIKIKKGTTVVWQNQDQALHQIASDPHPQHSKLRNLESEVMKFKDSYSFTFNETGTFTYHDHLNPLVIKGKVTVE